MRAQHRGCLLGERRWQNGNVGSCCIPALCWSSVKVRKWRAPCKGGVFPVGERPTRLALQPEAIGAVMEVTKWLEPLMWR
jgi:hypothetical protein